VPALKHGTASTYTNRGCRCEKCRQAAREARQSWVRSLQNRKFADVPHGTPSGYRNWGCRCDRCTTARRDEERRDRLRAGISSADMTAVAEALLDREITSTAQQRARGDQRTDRRRLASFLMITARHATGPADFALLADAVIPDQFRRSAEELAVLYERLLSADHEADPEEILKQAWEELQPGLRHQEEIFLVAQSALASSAADLQDAYREAMIAAASACVEAGGSISANTLVPLAPEQFPELAGAAIQCLKHRLEGIGYEPSVIPSRKRSRVRVYRLLQD
jgi:hypothetical protein